MTDLSRRGFIAGLLASTAAAGLPVSPARYGWVIFEPENNCWDDLMVVRGGLQPFAGEVGEYRGINISI